MPDNQARPPFEVAVEAVDEVGNPTILATLAVVAAILPMAFVGGLAGPYMRPIPIGARRQIESWRGHYNTDRPHSSLGYRTPLEFAALSRAAGQCSAGVGQGISNADPLPHTPIPAKTGEQIEVSCRMLE